MPWYKLRTATHNHKYLLAENAHQTHVWKLHNRGYHSADNSWWQTVTCSCSITISYIQHIMTQLLLYTDTSSVPTRAWSIPLYPLRRFINENASFLSITQGNGCLCSNATNTVERTDALACSRWGGGLSGGPWHPHGIYIEGGHLIKDSIEMQ